MGNCNSECVSGIALLAPFHGKQSSSSSNPSQKSGDGLLPLPSAQVRHRGPRYMRSCPANMGRMCSEAYDVEEDLLGQGAFGKIHVACSKKTGEQYVFKTMSKAVEVTTLEFFANEIEIHSGCDHPNIVRMCETFEDKTDVHMRLELCHGGDLGMVLDHDGALAELDACSLLTQVMQAVCYLHDTKRVAHRDLKVQNILLKSAGVPLSENTVKLTDFGMAMAFKPGRQSLTTFCGTPEYIAPEVFKGAYNERCDIWSCGIVLQYMLLNECPYDAEDLDELLEKAREAELIWDGFLWQGISKYPRLLGSEMCQLDPKRRPSARQVLSKLPWASVKQEIQLGALRRVRTAPDRLAEPDEEAHTDAGCTNACSTTGVAETTYEDNMAIVVQRFAGLCPFEKAAKQLVAYHLGDENTLEQHDIFDQLDIDKNGELSRDEVCNCLKDGNLANGCRGRSVLRALNQNFSNVDSSGSGCVEYTEFLGATLDVHEKCKLPAWKHACWEAFRVFDWDESGGISPEEMRKTLSSGFTKGGAHKFKISEILQKADLNHDGEIDFDEFVTMLQRT